MGKYGPEKNPYLDTFHTVGFEPTIWNKLRDSLKTTENVNMYKHKVKKHFFRKMNDKENNM